MSNNPADGRYLRSRTKNIPTGMLTDAELKRYDLRIVQYMTGHKRISSTERYQVGYLEDLQESINKCHPLV
ncbi:MAG TPA: hypothetical protein PLB27_00530 [Bacteroidales bacterium]|nr:hypothetical protein [Bacteroidales bacterium]